MNTTILTTGIYLVPGVGQVMITATGSVIIGGATVGSLTYNTSFNEFASNSFKNSFNRSAEDAVKKLNANGQRHIMNPKHNWNKIDKDPDWSKVAPILIEVLKKGNEQWEKGNVYTRTLVYKENQVTV